MSDHLDPPSFGWTKSGYAARKAAREFAEAAMSDELVKACPECGRLVQNHCWHDGYERYSVAMAPDAARDLRLAEYARLLADAEELLEPGDKPARVIVLAAQAEFWEQVERAQLGPDD